MSFVSTRAVETFIVYELMLFFRYIGIDVRIIWLVVVLNILNQLFS